MALRNYEMMFLLDSGKYATDPDGVNAEVNGILKKVGAEVIAARPWMDGKLAYEIEGHHKGLHYLVYAKAESENVQKLPRLCKLSTVVLRHLCILPPEKLFDLMVAALSEPESSAAPAEAAGETEDEVASGETAPESSGEEKEVAAN